MAQLVERSPSTQDVAGSNPARGSSFFLSRKKELSSGVVVYFALSVRMSLHVHHDMYMYACAKPCIHNLNVFVHEQCIYVYISPTYPYIHTCLFLWPHPQSDSDTVEAHAIISSCGPRDAKYLLEHVLDMVLNLVSAPYTHVDT